jgi:alpha-galactosidase
MPIDWDAETHEFHLRSEQLSYLVCLLENGALGQLHVGAPLTTGRSYRHLAPGEFRGFDNRLGDAVALEYPTEGIGDYRVPAIAVELANGSSALSLAFVRHRIIAGKPSIPGLPSTYVESDSEADTLEVTLADPTAGVQVDLRYSVFADRPFIARSAVIRNTGAGPIELRCAMSASLDLPDADWDLMQLSGTWARERAIVERRLAPGRVSIGSLRGASGHEHNPFLALKRPSTTEDRGEVIGLSLVYSGNFLAEAEVDPYGTARVRLGINPQGFSWHLEPGAAFATPEVILCWSAEGLGGLSDAYHSLYRERLARGTWRDRPRPVLLNSWEGAYFDFDEERLVAMASSARELGVELFVLDDGWFGSRDDDTTSLGDWFVDLRKLPNGLDGLARRIDDLDMGFGAGRTGPAPAARAGPVPALSGFQLAEHGRRNRTCQPSYPRRRRPDDRGPLRRVAESTGRAGSRRFRGSPVRRVGRASLTAADRERLQPGLQIDRATRERVTRRLPSPRFAQPSP